MQAEFEAKKSKEKLTNFEAENEVSLCHFLPNFVILNEWKEILRHSVILLPLRPVSLTLKNSQRRKVI